MNIGLRIATVTSACICVALSIASCSGASSTPAAGGDGGSTGGGGAGGPGCSTDADCTALLPQTNPADCAVGKCEALLGTCAFVARDADGDGHTAANCHAQGSGVIQAGDDCDDGDQTTYPAAVDACDGKNHTCATTQCACANDTTQACYDGTPASTRSVGACKDGTQVCTKGQWGPCDGQVKPKPVDLCDGKDENCDGNPNTNCPCQTGTTQVCNMGLCNPTTVACTNGAWPTCPTAIVATIYRQDGDTDQHCVGGALTLCPTAAASHVPAVRLSATCQSPDDCDDADPQRAAACNCASGSTKACNPSPACNPSTVSCANGEYPSCPAPSNPTFMGSPVGSACSAGTGSCARNGTVQCSGVNAANCSAVVGAPDATWHYAAAPNGSWDWNCDGVTELQFPHLVPPVVGIVAAQCLATNCNPVGYAVIAGGSICGATVSPLNCLSVNGVCQGAASSQPTAQCGCQ